MIVRDFLFSYEAFGRGNDALKVAEPPTGVVAGEVMRMGEKVQQLG